MVERLLSRNVLGRLALSLGVFLSACNVPTSPEEDLALGRVLQSSQGGGLGSAIGSSVAMGNTCGKSSDFHPSCVSNSPVAPDVFYSWTAPASDRYHFTSAGSDFDTVLELRSASSSSQVLACNDDDLVNYSAQGAFDVDLVSGQQVLVVVDSYGSKCGNYALGISAQCGGCDSPPPGGCYQPAGACVNGACTYSPRPAGSACDDGDVCTTGDTCNGSGVCSGTAGGCGTTNLGSSLGSAIAQGNTCGRPNQIAPTCGSSNASDQSYSWTAPFTGTFTLTTAGSAYDTILQVSDVVSGSSLGCNDDSNGTLQSSVAVALTQGQKLRIIVDGYGANCGAFSLNITGVTTRRGMTWVRNDELSTTGTCTQTLVTCNDCDPYQGDTLCSELRPLLCLKKDGSANCGPASTFDNGWTGGTLALTPFLVRGTELTSLAAANALCVKAFGAGYQMAGFHDGGGGWGWRASGSITPLSTPSSTYPRNGTPNLPNRFWVHINDQPANCWN